MNKNIGYIIYLVFACIVILISFVIGIKYERFTNNKIIEEYHEYNHLGHQINMTKKNSENYLKSYDLVNISSILDSIIFDIPKNITPFVGSAPSPGNYSTAYINEQQFRYFNKVEKIGLVIYIEFLLPEAQ